MQKTNEGLDEEVGLIHEGHVATHPELMSVSTTHTSAAKTKAFPGLIACGAFSRHHRTAVGLADSSAAIASTTATAYPRCRSSRPENSADKRAARFLGATQYAGSPPVFGMPVEERQRNAHANPRSPNFLGRFTGGSSDDPNVGSLHGCL